MIFNQLLYFIIVIIFINACSSKFESDDNMQVFKYNEAAGISSLDPAFAKDLTNIWACNHLFNGLVQLNDKLEIEPCIAKSWNISDDGLTYTFLLRDDVLFHKNNCFVNELHTRNVISSDVLYSFNRLVSSTVASPGLWVFNQVKNINGVYFFEAPNDSTFVINLKESFPPFLGILAMKYCSVIPEEAVNYFGDDFRNNPVGTGAFSFKLWKEGTKLVLLKNTHYFESENGVSLPYIDAVSISFLVDKQSAFLQFIQGKLDFISGIDASYKDEILTKSGKLNPKYEADVNMARQPYLNLEYLGILIDKDLTKVKNSPLSDIRIRQAINYGFDRVKMMKFLRNNIGRPGIYGVIPIGLPGFDNLANIGYNYDPEKSKELLNEAGYPNGQGLDEITISTNADYLDLCRFIQSQLNELGFNIKIEVNPPAALREMKAQSKLNFFRASWIADYPDAENYLSMFYSKNFCPMGPNYTHFKNESFDRLYEKSLTETDDSLRYSLYHQMDRIVMEQSPVVVLYYDQVLRFTQKNIEGLGSNAINMLDLKRVKKISLD